MSILRSTFSRARGAGVTDLAAFLAYYAALSIFPTIAVLVALLGLIGSGDTAKTLTDAISAVGPGSAVQALKGPINGLVRSNGQAGVAALVAFALALWASSGYVGGYVRAANAIHGVEESRPLVKVRATQLGLALAGVSIMALMLAAIGLSGPLLHSAAGSLGFGSTTETVFEIGRWPVLAGAGALGIALLARFGPDLDPRPWSAVVAGTLFSLVVWLVASGGFALYVATLGSYQATYATLAGAIVFLIWLWISNLALLAGVALNAELALRAGEQPTDEQATTGEHAPTGEHTADAERTEPEVPATASRPVHLA